MRQRSSRPAKGSFGARRTQPAASALDCGLGLLSRRAHSRVELRRKLGRRGYDDEETEEALNRLIKLGYLDDRSFAEGHVRRRSAGRGPLAISAELAARGVDRAHADAALAGFDADAQLESATRLAERLYASKQSLEYREMLNGIGSKLLRRGFSSTIVRAACRSVLARTIQPPDD